MARSATGVFLAVNAVLAGAGGAVDFGELVHIHLGRSAAGGAAGESRLLHQPADVRARRCTVPEGTPAAPAGGVRAAGSYRGVLPDDQGRTVSVRCAFTCAPVHDVRRDPQAGCGRGDAWPVY